jgi:L-threonylcarbamoyladenylate synthase
MQTLAVDPRDPDPGLIERAAAVLRAGGIVAFPTETVYGLGANALDEAAVRKIFAAKGRPEYNPLICHVADAAAARALVAHWPLDAERLAAAFWPGPLTLVLPKQLRIPAVVTAGLPTVAVRVPAHPVALALLRAAGVPVAAPSANPHTRVSPTRAEHVARGLSEGVDLILDGGPTSVGIESTVLDLAGEQPRLLRPGGISADELTAILGRAPIGAETLGATEPRPAPGMLDRHYAPRATVVLYEAAERASVERRAHHAAAAGQRVGALLLTTLDAAIDEPIVMPDDPAAYARRLYAALHEADDGGCDLLLIEQVPAGAAWAGVRDRLRRAAHRD